MWRGFFVLVGALLPSIACAGNGLNLIGFGAESVLMGGADTALARDTTALNTNPAGLARLPGSSLDLFGGLAYGSDVRHLDGLGNDRNVSNRFIPIGGFGYARRIGDTGLTAGVGFFAQGGAGSVFENLTTAFGTRDELSGLFAIARVSPGLAWRASDRLSLGVAIPITFADARQKVFPNTSFFNAITPAASFFGYELKGARTIQPLLLAGPVADDDGPLRIRVDLLEDPHRFHRHQRARAVVGRTGRPIP